MPSKYIEIKREDNIDHNKILLQDNNQGNLIKLPYF